MLRQVSGKQGNAQPPDSGRPGPHLIAEGLTNLKRHACAVMPWWLTAFFGAVGAGLHVQQFPWSAALAAVLALYCLPPIRRLLAVAVGPRFTKGRLPWIIVAVGFVALCVLAQRVQSRRLADFAAHREGIVGEARQALSAERYARVTELAARYYSADDPVLTALAAKAEAPRDVVKETPPPPSREERLIQQFLDAAEKQRDSQTESGHR